MIGVFRNCLKISTERTFKCKCTVARIWFMQLMHLLLSLSPAGAECRWMGVEELSVSEEATPLSHCVVRLLLEGRGRGFNTIDISMEELPSVFRNLTHKLLRGVCKDSAVIAGPNMAVSGAKIPCGRLEMDRILDFLEIHLSVITTSNNNKSQRNGCTPHKWVLPQLICPRYG